MDRPTLLCLDQAALEAYPRRSQQPPPSVMSRRLAREFASRRQSGTATAREPSTPVRASQERFIATSLSNTPGKKESDAPLTQ